MQITTVSVTAGGWVGFDTEPAVFVRFQEADDGRLEPVGVVLADGVLSNRVLQGIPFGRIEALANVSELAGPIRESLTESITDPNPTATREFEIPNDLIGGGYSPLEVFSELDRLAETAPGWSGRHSDRFYTLIAALYQWQASHSQKPGALLAERLDVPVANVWRWVRVCRDKGYLPPARVGKEG